MPELPEVETVCQGIAPHITQQTIYTAVVRQDSLRWPVDGNLAQILSGQRVESVVRRGKYILFHTQSGTLLIHLGMSGSLRIADQQQPIKKHDHVDLLFDNGIVLRFNDPRRFGAILWTTDVVQHPLLKNLGPEPLLSDFSAVYLHQAAKSRKMPVKSFIMDNHIVVGVGNIYANEALFAAQLHPCKPANMVSLEEFTTLVACIRSALASAIAQGGTTLRDFVNEKGKPGYFQQQLQVYGRAGSCCKRCGQILQEVRINNRSTVFCPICQGN